MHIARNVDGRKLVNAVRVIGHVNVGVGRGIERAITAIAPAVDLRVRPRAHEQRQRHLKNFLFHRFGLKPDFYGCL